MTGGPRPGAYLVDVAVPLPLPEPLLYLVPEALQDSIEAGVRVAVRVGGRRLRGIVLGRSSRAIPVGVEVREVEAVLDAEPVLTGELLELGKFISSYYLCPIGEVLRSLLPGDLPAWGVQKIWLTSSGALAASRDALEARLVDRLLAEGRLSRSSLAAAGEDRVALFRTVDRMLDEGRLASDSGDARQRARFEAAYELAPGALESHLAAAGRSPAGRSVIQALADLGRPAALPELTAAAGCGESVPRRLAKLGILRAFQQPLRLALDRHQLRGSADRPATLTSAQETALTALAGAIESRTFSAHLLAGVTGSGKTEVYLQAAERALALGRSAMILVPEIALVPSLARAARQRFGERLALLHSSLDGGERHQEWERVRSGVATVALGPRSALFAPLVDLGLVVVDEEHEAAFKQEQDPRYNARDLALMRARTSGATAVLVSATPSLESRWNVLCGKLGKLTLPDRVGEATLPEGIIVDLREEPLSRLPGGLLLSGRLQQELEETLASGAQAILLRNRRGFAPLLLCRACGELFSCDDCGLPRTLHRRDGTLICHYCGSTLPAPSRCPTCREAALEAIGSGTERVEAEVAARFPGVGVAVLDRDEVRRRGSVAEILEEFARGESRILIGTQMVAKGHHFPEVALTGVLAADSYLAFPDFRAVERTYSQLVQLAGRAGRGSRRGKVVIQTFHPDHYAIRAALDHDDEAFAREEMRFRRAFHYPPFSRMIQVLLRDRRRESAAQWMRELAERLRQVAGDEPGLRLTGPAPAPFERLRGEWRFQLLMRGPSGSRLRELLRQSLPQKLPRGLVIDVDPQHLL